MRTTASHHPGLCGLIPAGTQPWAATLTAVLANLIPEKSQAILARSAEYAYSREVCGDHYHSDVEAGDVLGTVLGILLLNNATLKTGDGSRESGTSAPHTLPINLFSQKVRRICSSSPAIIGIFEKSPRRLSSPPSGSRDRTAAR